MKVRFSKRGNKRIRSDCASSCSTVLHDAEHQNTRNTRKLHPSTCVCAGKPIPQSSVSYLLKFGGEHRINLTTFAKPIHRADFCAQSNSFLTCCNPPAFLSSAIPCSPALPSPTKRAHNVPSRATFPKSHLTNSCLFNPLRLYSVMFNILMNVDVGQY